MKILEPQYEKDILKQLRYCSGMPAAYSLIIEYMNAIKHSTARAADEIEKLRRENKKLRKELGRIKI